MLMMNPQPEKKKSLRGYRTWWENLLIRPILREIELIAVLEDMNETRGIPDCQQHSGDHHTLSEQATKVDGDEVTDSFTLEPGQILPGTRFTLWNPAQRNGSKRLASSDEIQNPILRLYQDLNTPLPNIDLTSRDVTRWKMAWRASVKYYRPKDQYWAWRWVVSRRLKNWLSPLGLWCLQVIGPGISAAAFVYGGLHALAWFAHFGSSTERLLWRISVPVVMGGLPVIMIAGLPLIVGHGYTSMMYLLLFFPFFLFPTLLAYMLARAYLVVECFINLSHLPAEAYDVPNWSAYFPHIA